MQTFLPYSSFVKTAQCLDDKRLGNQRNEALIIYKNVVGISNGWKNHPAVKQWIGYNSCLMLYYNAILQEWINRGKNNSMPFMTIHGEVQYPQWIGDETYHASHRSNLLRKNYAFYSQYKWAESPDLPYCWPSKIKQYS